MALEVKPRLVLLFILISITLLNSVGVYVIGKVSPPPIVNKTQGASLPLPSSQPGAVVNGSPSLATPSKPAVVSGKDTTKQVDNPHTSSTPSPAVGSKGGKGDTDGKKNSTGTQHEPTSQPVNN